MNVTIHVCSCTINCYLSFIVEDTLINNEPLPLDSMLSNDNAISTPATDTEHSSTPDTVGNNGGVAHRTDFEKYVGVQYCLLKFHY